MTLYANIAAVDDAAGAQAPTDEAAGLVRRTAGGDHDALRALYTRYGALAHALALRLLGDRHLAEEVVEDVFFTVWRQARRYDPRRGGVGAWIVGLTRNRAVEHLRGDPPAVAAAAERAEAAARVVADLPARQLEVLRLAYFDRGGPAQIATRLGVDAAVVEERLRLALNHVRTLAR